MKQLRNKIGDLAVVVDSCLAYDGMVVECIEYKFSGWSVKNKRGYYMSFQDSQLIPLGGEHILQDEPRPELNQGCKAELPKEEQCK